MAADDFAPTSPQFAPGEVLAPRHDFAPPLTGGRGRGARSRRGLGSATSPRLRTAPARPSLRRLSSENAAREVGVTELRVHLPDDVLEFVAERAAAIVLERLADEHRNGDSEFVSVAEAAELLRAKPQRIYDLLSDGRLSRHKDGSRVLVSRSELVAHLRPTPRRRRMSNGVAR